jgi:hypothetical protein
MRIPGRLVSQGEIAMARLRPLSSTCAAAVLLTCGLVLPIGVSAKQPVVVELFTSQGCNSCPPANDNLIRLREQAGVLALSFGVTYWDRLGWKDTFARSDFTARQGAYEPKLGRSGPFTPQMVIDGRTDAIGHDLSEVQALIDRARPRGGPDLKLSPTSLTIGSGPAPSAPADVWLVRYDPKIAEVPVRRGENSGRTLAHTHVVRDLVRLGTWTGREAVLPVAAAPLGLRTAVLVQLPKGGPILAAVTD